VLADLESRLADLLGSRLAPPFRGNVAIAPGPADVDAAPSLTVAVTDAWTLRPDFGSIRTELVPGSPAPRRVLRLRCNVTIAVRTSASAGRGQAMDALDAILYELDHPDLRQPGTLTSPADDPGFALDSLTPVSAWTEPEDGLPHVVAEAVGWFWPRGVSGVAGSEIVEARVRTVNQPLTLEPWPLLRTGDPAVALTLTAASGGTMVLDGEAVTAAGFGALAMRLVDDGGRPGAGTLDGGDAGPGGSRIVPLIDGRAAIAYTPPAEATTDHLVVAVAGPDTGDGPTVGIELARFSLVVDG
jgi:hypothetical protein